AIFATRSGSDCYTHTRNSYREAVMSPRRLLLILLVSLVPACFAQTAQITGIVSDPSGVVVPGAEITVTNIDTGIKKAATSNEQGVYTIPLLNPGNYELAVQKEGFKAISRPGIKLEVAQIARMDFTLQVGELIEKVTVVSEAPILTSESAVIGQVVGNKKILDLPLNGRDFTQLATLVPGAISRGTNSSME